MASPTDTRASQAARQRRHASATQNIAGRAARQTASGSIPGSCAGPNVHAHRRRRQTVDEYSETNNTWSGAL